MDTQKYLSEVFPVGTKKSSGCRWQILEDNLWNINEEQMFVAVVGDREDKVGKQETL